MGRLGWSSRVVSAPVMAAVKMMGSMSLPLLLYLILVYKPALIQTHTLQRVEPMAKNPFGNPGKLVFIVTHIKVVFAQNTIVFFRQQALQIFGDSICAIYQSHFVTQKILNRICEQRIVGASQDKGVDI